MICKTTRKHYEEFRDMAKKAGITLKGAERFGTKEELAKKFLDDPWLNNINMYTAFDPLYPHMLPKMHRLGYKGFSLADNVCLYKHLIIYEILECEPEFYTDWKHTVKEVVTRETH